MEIPANQALARGVLPLQGMLLKKKKKKEQVEGWVPVNNNNLGTPNLTVWTQIFNIQDVK